MKLLLFLATLAGLAACGSKEQDHPGATVCTPYASAYEVLYPDGETVKSSVSVCSDGAYQATSMDGKKSTKSSRLTIQLIDLDAQGNRTPYFVAFAAQ